METYRKAAETVLEKIIKRTSVWQIGKGYEIETLDHGTVRGELTYLDLKNGIGELMIQIWKMEFRFVTFNLSTTKIIETYNL